MVHLTYLNSGYNNEIKATVSVTISENSSRYKVSYMPLKSIFDGGEFEEEVKRLYFDIEGYALVLCAYDQEEFKVIKQHEPNFITLLVSLKGKYKIVEDFDEE
jgi:hypothetical protein